MSLVSKANITVFQRFCINVLKCGPVPNHVAIIMDGNRRFAKNAKIRPEEGHFKGYCKLVDCFKWCIELGIRELTVYAFSIENFKRSKDEVDNILKLTGEKLMELLGEQEQLMSDGICVRIIGNLSFVSEDLRKIIEAASLLTKNNNKHILNLAFSYVSREEITNSIKTIVQGVEDGLIENDDVSEELISQCLYTRLSSNPDILIRTSGEVRLSDFLLWQISKTEIRFTEVLWPEFSIWDFLSCVFKYQRSHDIKSPPQNIITNRKIDNFIKTIELKRRQQSLI